MGDVKLEEMHIREVIGFRITSIFTHLNNYVDSVIYKQRLRRNSL